ncbi:hypothetical protein [Bradyrhizobium macuxiense]|uniref:hypothetical protein n=1 Tax=Bradyrhizobium macuxiense TaxID=1755647 RepID=UPI0011BE7B0B|nr:hypothetical protein [Bradyrhizobium macuxiense]
MTSLLNAMSGNFFAGLCLACREPSVLIEKGKGFCTAANGGFTTHHRVLMAITGMRRTAFFGGQGVRQNRSAAGDFASVAATASLRRRILRIRRNRAEKSP